MFTYTVSISCVLYRRIAHPDLLPPARWGLGRWGIPINVLGLAYALFSFFWSFWPTYTPVTAEGFNWSVVIFVAVLLPTRRNSV
jgi:amino acid transporter